MAIWTKLKIASFCIQKLHDHKGIRSVKDLNFYLGGTWKYQVSSEDLNFSFATNRKCPTRINRVTGSSSRLRPLPSSCKNLHLIREGRLVTQDHTPWTFAFLVVFSEIQIFIYYKNNKLNITRSQFQPQYKYFGKMKLLVQIARVLKQPSILILSSVWMLR